MANRTAWTAGNNPAGLTYTQCNGAELVSLATGSTALLTGVPVTTQAASGTWTTGTASITLSGSNVSIAPGQLVFDNTVGAGGYLGIVSTIVGTALTLTANAAHASSGSTDTLAFSLPIANGAWSPASLTGYLDQLMDVSITSTITSSTPSANSGFGLYLAYLQRDGVTWGSGEMTPGSVITRAPALIPSMSTTLESTSATTLLVGDNGPNPIGLRPRVFLPALYNNSSLSLSATAANNVVAFATYNINLND